MLEEQAFLDFYGLEQDPFSPELARSVFCGFGKRQDVLEQLIHLNQFSHLKILVLAPHGYGKTSLFAQFRKKLSAESNIHLACFRGKPDVSASQFLEDLAASWRVAATSSKPEALLQQLRKFNLAETTKGRRHVIAIDDADCFSQEVLEILQELTAGLPDEQCIGVTLFAQEGLVDFRDIFRPASDLHSIHLPAFNSREAMQMLQEYFSQAGLKQGLPFTPKELEKIYLASEGVPARIKKVARQFMQEQTKQKDSQSKMPWVHMLAVAALLVLVVGSFLYQNQQQVDKTATQQIPEQETIRPVSQSDSVEERLKAAAEKVEQRQAQLARESEAELKAELLTTHSAPEPISTPQTEELNEEVNISEEVIAEPAPVTSLQEVEEPVEEIPEALATPVVKADPEPKKPEYEPKEEAKTNAVSKAEALSRPQPKPWFEQADGGHFTIQLFGSYNLDSAKKYISELNVETPIAYYKTTYKEKDWYVVITGDYPNRGAALSAVSGLNRKNIKGKPWVRTFDSIRAPK